MTDRGYGVSAAVDPEAIAPLAARAEQAGYSTFWVNDVPGANGLEQLKRAQDATSTMRLGVGVLPVDRWSARQILAEIERLQLSPERIAVGVGAGALHTGSLDATASVAAELLSSGQFVVLIGALGPAMCRLAGAGAHGVILNWLTPEAAEQLAQLAREGAASVGRPSPDIVAYVRTAANTAARSRLEREAAAYEGYPAYARHFRRMGVAALETTVNGSAAEINRYFNRFAPAAHEVVARASAVDDTLEAYLEVLEAAKPAASV
jgi:alkanesulfonate monooxygenase SsuD/methylene tetrahydromethanopterin reductase-like flavin-dependent oxidoreductase (luciferase family)